MSARIGRGRAGRLFAERKRRLFLPSPRLLPRLQPRPFCPVRCGNPKPPVPLIWCQNSSGRSDGANVSKGCLYSVIVQPLDARTVLAKLAFVYTTTHTHTPPYTHRIIAPITPAARVSEGHIPLTFLFLCKQAFLSEAIVELDTGLLITPIRTPRFHFLSAA